jgi:hypothetical protein
VDERFYLVRAQEADAFSNAAERANTRRQWEIIGNEYRRLAHAKAAERRAGVRADPVEN